MKSLDPLVVIFERNAFYRRQYLLALFALLLNIGVVIVLLWVICFLILHPIKVRYFAADEVGRLLPIVPVSKPNMTTQEVMQWTIQVIEKIYSYDYVNYHAQMQQVQRYFTEYGWSKYISALTASNNLLALSNRKLITIAKVTGTPTILAEGLLGQAYAWKMQVPVLVTYWFPPYEGKSNFSNPLTVTILVQRQSILQSDQGLGIVQIISNIAASAIQSTEITNMPMDKE